MEAVVVTNGEELDALYEELLVPNFPAEELESRAHLHRRRQDGSLSVLCVRAADGARLGVAIGETFGRITLLSYLAVSASSRGTGAGGVLLEAAASRWLAEPDVEAVLAEVARPDRHTAHPLHGDPAAG